MKDFTFADEWKPFEKWRKNYNDKRMHRLCDSIKRRTTWVLKSRKLTEQIHQPRKPSEFNA